MLTPFCNETEWEEKVKKLSRAEALKEGEVELETTATSVAAKTLCIPHDQVLSFFLSFFCFFFDGDVNAFVSFKTKRTKSRFN